MAKKKRSKKKSERTGIGEIRFIVIALVLAGIGYFLKDFNGESFHFVGSYIWFFAFIITFLLALFYFAQFILPLDWHESWYEGIRLVATANFPMFFSMLGGKITKPNPSDDVKSRLPKGFMKHGSAVFDSPKALALIRGSVFTRAAGPGHISLNRGENVSEIIDLRRHIRSLPVEAITRDGIPINSTLSIVFQVKQEDDPGDAYIPYPYESDAVFQVNYLSNINTEEGPQVWSERIAREGVNLLVAEFTRHVLDALFIPDQSGAPPMEKITGHITEQLEASFGKYGVAIISVSVGRITMPEDVSDQRISNWQVEWQEKAQAELAAGDAEALRRMKLARARAQVEIIAKITESIENMRRSGEADLADIVTLRIVEAMDQAVEDDSVQALVPLQAVATLNQVHALLQEWNN